MKRILITGLTIFIVAFTVLPLTAQQPATPAPAASAAPVAAAAGSDFASGMKLYRQGKYAQAVTIFEGVPSDSPDYAAACYFAGYAHYVMRHFPQAVASFEKAFQANPAFDPRPYFRAR